MFDIHSFVPLIKEIQASSGPVGASSLCSSPTLHMSQATIGRQLTVLEEQGILQKVSNKGRILTRCGLEAMRRVDASSTKSKIAEELVSLSLEIKNDALIQIVEIRQLLEPHAAGNAARRADKKDLQNLEDLAFTHRYLLSCAESANEADLKFHLTIARLSGNEPLYKILELLLTDNGAYIEFSKAGDAQKDMQVECHFKILDAIQSRDASAAKHAMMEHLQHVYQDVHAYSLNPAIPRDAH